MLEAFSAATGGLGPTAVVGGGSSLVVGAVVWGVFREKVRRLEEDVKDIETRLGQYVTLEHFKDVINPMREDLKEILMLLRRDHS